MDAKERIEKMLENTGLSRRAFSFAIEMSENKLREISRGRVGNFSQELCNAICSKFPQFNKTWLLTGEGEMLSAPSAPKDEKATMLDLMTRLMASIERSQQQFDRMLAMHERIIYGKDDALERYKKMAKDADDLADVDIKAS